MPYIVKKKTKKTPIWTISERLGAKTNTAIHSVACAMTCVVMEPFVSVFTMAAMAITSCLYTTVSQKIAARKTKETSIKLDERQLIFSHGSHNLPRWAKQIAKDLGLKETPPLYTMNEQRNDGHQSKMASVPFAFSSHDQNNLYQCHITEPLLKLLNSREEKAILAHELAHAAADHIHEDKQSYILSQTSMLIKMVPYFCMMPSLAWAESIAGTVAACYLFQRAITKHMADPENTKASHLSSKRKKIDVASTVLTFGLMSTFPILLGAPLLSAAFVLPKITEEGLYMVRCKRLRQRESQADRIAAKVTGDPLALASALKKIENYYNPPSVQKDNDKDLTVAFYDFYTKLKAIHPPTPTRIRRLEKMAQKSSQTAP